MIGLGFKVGDKVKVVDNYNVFVELGSLGIVQSFNEDTDLYAVKFKEKTQHLNVQQLKLSKNKNKKRIKKLEKEVAELKLIVAKLREPSNLIKEELFKSNNELRAEVIDNAKSFVQYHENENWEFVISEKLHRVLAFNLKLKYKNFGFHQDYLRVFNEHIWKAIALGRALNLDVSEFENCVQPDFAVGQKIEWNNDRTKYDILELNDGYCSKFYSYISKKELKVPNKKLEDCAFIINDTNAIYEVK